MGPDADAVADLIAAWFAALTPPPSRTISEWADAERVLSSAASPTPGRWRTSREPWQRAIMDALHEGAETIVVQKSAQVGITESLVLNAIGYHIAHDPCPMLLVEPSEALAKRLSKNRLAYMLAATPSVAARVAPPRARGSSNTLLHKSFDGGYLVLAGANSPTALASDPMRIVFFDEVDKYPPHLGDEGDPVSLGMRRTERFWNRRHVLISTPTRRGTSTIEAWYAQSDQRRYEIPCPRCDAAIVLRWSCVQWVDDDPQTAYWRCPACGGRIEDWERPALIARGRWQPTAPFRGVIGFHVWAALMSTTPLARIVDGFLRARALGIESLREWQNQALGETWEDEGEAIEPQGLLARCERYPTTADGEGLLPAGVLYLTMGTDTQDDRLECRVWGWGLGEEAWLIDIRTLPGDPAKPEVWAMHDELLEREWPHALGHRPTIAACAIDSAGHRTDHVYAYVRRHQHRHVYATIGRDGQRPLWSPALRPGRGKGRRAQRRQVPLSIVGVDAAKSLWHSRLRLEAPGPGYVHLPRHPAVEEEVEQLTSERLVTRYRRGVPYRVWELARPNARNEGLDCAILALWALRALGGGTTAGTAALLRTAAERIRTTTEIAARLEAAVAAASDPGAASAAAAVPHLDTKSELEATSAASAPETPGPAAPPAPAAVPATVAPRARWRQVRSAYVLTGRR